MRLKTTNKKAGLFRLSKEYCFRMMIVLFIKPPIQKGRITRSEVRIRTLDVSQNAIKYSTLLITRKDQFQ